MKIDYVVPYVDGSDPAWLDVFMKCKKEANQPFDENELKKRYSENRLFKYHFRSIEKFMPWIGTIHLLVMQDSQIPKWINRGAVHVVRHDEFIPQEFLPTFNSGVIECFLHRIPGLAPCFIYANDDMYLFGEMKPSDFFDGCMPLVRCSSGKTHGAQYDDMCAGMTKFIFGRLGLPYEEGRFMRSQHGHRAFGAALYRRIYEEFRDYVDGSCTRFRSSSNVTESFFAVYYFLSTGCRYKGRFSTKYLSFDDRDRLVKFFAGGGGAQSVCINNNDGDDLLLLSYMDRKFHSRSKYEKEA